MVKTKPGMSDDYLKALAKLFKATNDEMKKQGLILDYKILLGDSANPHDFDVLLMVEFKNMAAFDGLRKKSIRSVTRSLGANRCSGRVQLNGWRSGRSWATS